MRNIVRSAHLLRQPAGRKGNGEPVIGGFGQGDPFLSIHPAPLIMINSRKAATTKESMPHSGGALVCLRSLRWIHGGGADQNNRLRTDIVPFFGDNLVPVKERRVGCVTCAFVQDGQQVVPPHARGAAFVEHHGAHVLDDSLQVVLAHSIESLHAIRKPGACRDARLLSRLAASRLACFSLRHHTTRIKP
jgi:hypothetical protein